MDSKAMNDDHNNDNHNLPKGIEYDDKLDLYNHYSFTNPEQEPYIIMCKDRIRRKDWTCTCKGFMYNQPKKCKHITRIEFIDEANRKIDRMMPQKKGLIK